MNFDLGGPVLEIAIGLAFVFFLLSVIASALTEFWAGIFNLRAKTLREGLEGLLGDKGVVEAVLSHALVRTDLTKELAPCGHSVLRFLERLLPRAWRKYERPASYIAPEVFAAAFASVHDQGNDDEISDPRKRAERAVLKQQIAALPGGSATANPQAPAIEKWFDAGMERVSGWYKRKSQLVTLVFAAVVTIGLNASALQIAQKLESDPSLRATLTKKAEEVTANEEPSKEAAGNASKEISEAVKHAETALGEVNDLKLPLLWGEENLPKDWAFSQIALWIAGLLLTTIAISLGAPFWFDALGKLSNLRLAGKKPEAETPGAA